jgi:hypothetical protein
VTRARAAEYRHLGQEILAMARSVSSQEARTALMEGQNCGFAWRKSRKTKPPPLRGESRQAQLRIRP